MPDMDRVSDMEKKLKECELATDGLERELDRMRKIRGDMISLFGYYGSPEWYDDREGALPEGTAAGVLSEDSVYDLITRLRDTAFDMLETATDILKNRL